ncbi:PEP/pyruvate-binding domain-containing protein [Paenibacillus solani]|uniref:PEP/pyruvate-binding domain-containing protein n=1 Tax=Paenibacillus solani TaxID=1705565 RepID=UPI003D27D264
MKYVKQLNAIHSHELQLVGGKTINLGTLVQCQLPVPSGFCITTKAYLEFVQHNQLGEHIAAQLGSVLPADLATAEKASERIRELFEESELSQNMLLEITQAYHHLYEHNNDNENNNVPVAIRSSATAEDLADLSFAGQQDTYLNIVGSQQVIEHVVKCWSSLWTARAILYRIRNHIDQNNISLAVVVQRMVNSKASGVMFTANPVTGRRNEIVIDATMGLGELLVSGGVEPDHYVVDLAESRIASKQLGVKSAIMQSLSHGGTHQVKLNDAEQQQAINDEHIMELAQLGRLVQTSFGTPQDIEWAIDEQNRLFLLQTRPITSLYPLPRRIGDSDIEGSTDSLRIWFSFASWQGVLDPLTPMGQSVLSQMVTQIALKLGLSVEQKGQDAFHEAAQRLYVNITPLMQNAVGRRALSTIMSSLDPVILSILTKIMNDPRLAAKKPLHLRAKVKLARKILPVWLRALYNVANSSSAHERLQRRIDIEIDSIKSRLMASSNNKTRLQDINHTFQDTANLLLQFLLPGTLSGHIPLHFLIQLTDQLPDGFQYTLDLTRSLPFNITSEMDLNLWNVAVQISSDSDSNECFKQCSTQELCQRYRTGSLPDVAHTSISHFMSLYGMRGLSEIDIGRRRWEEDPEHIIQVIKSYLEAGSQLSSPLARYEQGIQSAEQAIQKLRMSYNRSPLGFVKSTSSQILARKVRMLAGIRETPKFTIIRIFQFVRHALLDLGEELQRNQILSSKEDIFFLHLNEVKELIESEAIPSRGDSDSVRWQELIEHRKTTYIHESKRNKVPRVLLSDGTTYYDDYVTNIDHEKQSGSVIRGNPVSPGTYEGTVCVIHDPYKDKLAPGEILVCSATDPAWTPLFLVAGGLVMEVGGMMTHGSIIAREYGLPAVVGIKEATSRLRNGQRVRIDGLMGTVEIIQSNNNEEDSSP